MPAKSIIIFRLMMCSFLTAAWAGVVKVPSKGKHNYSDAKQACQEEGMDLVSVETVTKWETIKTLITELGYIGEGLSKELLRTVGSSLPDKQSYKWENGEEFLDNSSYWEAVQPNRNHGQQYCVIIQMFDGGIVRLNDWFCDSNISGYLCETKKDGNTPRRRVFSGDNYVIQFNTN